MYHKGMRVLSVVDPSLKGTVLSAYPEHIIVKWDSIPFPMRMDEEEIMPDIESDINEWKMRAGIAFDAMWEQAKESQGIDPSETSRQLMRRFFVAGYVMGVINLAASTD